MNIFVLDLNPSVCAKYTCDKHVGKMILEHAQLMSICCRFYGYDIGYKSSKSHENHPCAKWVQESSENWYWLRDLTFHLNKEYRYRYNKTVNHASWDLINTLSPPDELLNVPRTPFVLAMPDCYKVPNNPVLSYRNYYIGDKLALAKWTRRKPPEWWGA